ncbi:MAG: hypothetical protein LBT44_04325 [Clostridiales bacterium]|jgi:hypothetical protein|nr:hypothetical protein [Clostridiales bacterium]
MAVYLIAREDIRTRGASESTGEVKQFFLDSAADAASLPGFAWARPGSTALDTDTGDIYLQMSGGWKKYEPKRHWITLDDNPTSTVLPATERGSVRSKIQVLRDNVKALFSYFANGAANNAVKLLTPRAIRTKLDSTDAENFDGTRDITPGVTGSLPVGNGGTGRNTITAGSLMVGNGTTQVNLVEAPTDTTRFLGTNGISPVYKKIGQQDLPANAATSVIAGSGTTEVRVSRWGCIVNITFGGAAGTNFSNQVSSQLCFTIPSGYRPAYQQRWTIIDNSGANYAGTVGMLESGANGAVYYFGMRSGAGSLGSDKVRFQSASFITADAWPA